MITLEKVNGFQGECWKEGVDGTEMFPLNHKLILDTQRAKVVRVYIPKNSAEAPHTHNIKSWMFTDVPTTLDDLEGRPPVWYLSPQASYKIESSKSENLYLLKV